MYSDDSTQRTLTMPRQQGSPERSPERSPEQTGEQEWNTAAGQGRSSASPLFGSRSLPQEAMPGQGRSSSAHETAGTGGTGDATGAGEAANALKRRLLDAVMSFLEAAEGRYTYHQAQLIRLACCGLDSAERIEEARYVLERAWQSADSRPASLPVSDAFNDSIMDLIESQADALSYCEGEILRRAARGCNRTELEEIAFLLRRAHSGLQTQA